MKRKPITFSINEMKDMQSDARHWASIDFTTEQVEKLLKSRKKVCAGCASELRRDYDSCTNPSDGKGMDTYPRDIWFDLIANYFTNRCWPLNGDSQTVSRNFFRKLEQGLKDFGAKMI